MAESVNGDGRPTLVRTRPHDDAASTVARRKPGEHLWTIRTGGRQIDCELCDHGAWGVEVQIYREGEFRYGRRWATLALALEEADSRKAQYLSEGGVFIASAAG